MGNIIHEEIKNSLETMMSEQYVKHLLNTKISLSNKEVKSLNNLFRSRDSEETREQVKLNLLKGIFLSSVWFGDEAISQARKKWIFHYKAWGYEKNYVIEILVMVKKFHRIFNYSDKTMAYIETKISMSWLYEFYKNQEGSIETELIKQETNRAKYILPNGNVVETSVAKDLLAYLDLNFLKRKKHYIRKPYNLNNFESYRIVEIAVAISYLISVYDNVLTLIRRNHCFCDAKNINNSDIKNLVLLACKLKQVEEWETKIDFLDYNVTIEGRKTTITASNPQEEKSIVLAHIYRDMREMEITQSILFYQEKEIMSLERGCKKMKKYLLKNCVTKLDIPFHPKVRVDIPKTLIENFCGQEDFFLEEITAIAILSERLKITPNDFLQKKITKNANIGDVLRFQRFFIILDYCQTFLFESKTSEKKCINSLIPTCSQENLVEYLTPFIQNRQALIELLELFTYKKGEILDIQYSPLVNVGVGTMLPLSIIAQSNLTRNCIAQSRNRNLQTTNEGKEEPLVKETLKYFNDCTFPYQLFANKKIKFTNKNTECDVLVISDSRIIIFECKDTIHPVNLYEERATLDSIKKASSQLDIQFSAFSDRNFIEKFCNEHNLPNNNRKIQTCILLGNKLYHGCTHGSHPIRSLDALSMVLTTGIFRIQEGGWHIWGNNMYSEKELDKFLSDDYPLDKTMFNTLTKIETYLTVDNHKLVYESYSLDVRRVVTVLDSTFDSSVQ